jgi:hypothetical protein
MPFRFFTDLLYNHLAFVQQFRSLEGSPDFLLCIYGLCLVPGLSGLSQVENGRPRLAALLLTFVVFSLYFVESYAYHRENSAYIKSSPNLFNLSLISADTREVIDRINHIKKGYQCLIPLPYYNVGNENFSTWTSDKNSDQLLYHFPFYGYAHACQFRSRSPIPEGKKSMQFFTPPLFTKEIKKDLPNTQPFFNPLR